MHPSLLFWLQARVHGLVRSPNASSVYTGHHWPVTPLMRFAVSARRPVICLVGYRYQEVSSALDSDNTYVLSDNPAGGTAFAAYEAFCVPELVEKNPLLIITMGDRDCSILCIPQIIEGTLRR